MAATFAFGEPNAVTIGFLFGALGQFLAIGALLLFHSPTIIIAGFIPLFFDNAAFGVFANRRAGKILGIAGIVVVVLILVLIPQLEYRHDPKNYFLMVTDYEQYKENVAKKKEAQ